MTSQLQRLNYLLKTKDWSIISSNNIDDKFFSEYKNEFNFIKNHYETYKTRPDQLTFLNVFPDFQLTDVNEPASYLLEQLYKDRNTEYLAYTFNQIKHRLEAGDTDKATDYFRKATENIHIGAAVTSHDFAADTSRFDQYLEMSKDKSKYYISTGFKELDKLIYGIDRRNELRLIAARPGQMKTWTLLKMAVSAAVQGLKVGLYSGEMDKNKCFYRMDTLLNHFNNAAIRHGDLFIEKDYMAYRNNLKDRLKGGAIKVITPNDIAGPANVGALQAFIEKDKLDILFVDQYSLLEDSSGARQPFERVANISKARKNLQVRKQIPIVAVSQMNRTKLGDGSDDSIQDVSQIAMSDRLGQDATCVIMLSRKDDDKLVLNLVKLRDGASDKKLTYHVDINVGRFDFIDTDNTAADPTPVEDEMQNFKADDGNGLSVF